MYAGRRVNSLVSVILAGMTLAPVPGKAASRRDDLEVLERTTRNKKVALQLRDGQILRGRFMGVVDSPESAYVARYAAWRDSAEMDVPLPAIGDSIRLRVRSDRDLEGRLAGFSPGYVLLRRAGRAGITHVGYKEFTALVDTAAREIPTSRLRILDEEAVLPVVAGVLIDTPEGTRWVPFDRIEGVHSMAYGRWWPRIFDGRRQGIVLGVGAGLAPLVSIESSDIKPRISDSGSGSVLDIMMGVGFTSSDIVALQARSVGISLAGWDARQQQTFRGAVWFHSFGPPGRSLVASLGMGLVTRETNSYSCGCFCLFGCPPCPNPCPEVLPPEGNGIGYHLGIGYEFHRRYRVGAYGLFGSIKDPGQGDWGVRQFSLEMQATWY